jgi:amphi-Trp domain-containing protein
MPEEQLFNSEEQRSRTATVETLESAAEEIRAGTVRLEDEAGEQTVTIPDEPTLEVELERATDSETGEQYYELEYELSWTESDA